MDLLRALVAFEGEPALFGMDAIEYQGKAWLVPEWIQQQGSEYAMPARIIQIDNLQHQRIPKDSGAPYQFSLSAPIPKAVCEGRDPKSAERGYIVVERPLGIQIRMPSGIQ
jgi:hypothetical protein